MDNQALIPDILKIETPVLFYGDGSMCSWKGLSGNS